MLSVSRVLVFLLIGVFNSSLYAEPDQKEVIGFINKKFQQYGYAYYSKNNAQTKIDLKCQKNGICILSFTLFQEGDKEDQIYKFNLQDLDVNKIDYPVYYKDTFFVRLYCKDIAGECVSALHYVSSPQPGVYFYIHYKSQAEKIKKAFTYLINKYNTKKELF